MRKRMYEAFTLIEMLIVMAILIILMVIGIAAGRFALNRANDVAHQNAVDQLYQGLQAYYTDNRTFPTTTECGGVCTPAAMMSNQEILGKYMDLGAFNGGTSATFIYFVGGDNNDQAVMVCASMRGLKAESDEKTDGAYYCNGNGFGVDNLTAGATTFPQTFTDKSIEKKDGSNPVWVALSGSTFTTSSDWDNLAVGGMGWTELE